VVFVSGHWHGSWCWSLVVEELAADGVLSVAIDLPGQGILARQPASWWERPFDRQAYSSEVSPASELPVSELADALVAKLRRIGRGGPCVVVAHSMNAVVATAAAEAEPHLFASIVYVAAFAPTSGRSALHYLASPEISTSLVSPLLCNDPAVIGAFRLDSGLASDHPKIKDALYADVAPGIADGAVSLLQSDGPAAVTNHPVHTSLDRFGRIPHIYVLCEDDQAVPAAVQENVIADIDASSQYATKVERMSVSHSPFFSRPAELANIIAQAAGTEPQMPGGVSA
jgi:pimeloyl-ACP methyl ester carboxylesterase